MSLCLVSISVAMCATRMSSASGAVRKLAGKKKQHKTEKKKRIFVKPLHPVYINLASVTYQRSLAQEPTHNLHDLGPRCEHMIKRKASMGPSVHKLMTKTEKDNSRQDRTNSQHSCAVRRRLSWKSMSGEASRLKKRSRQRQQRESTAGRWEAAAERAVAIYQDGASARNKLRAEASMTQLDQALTNRLRSSEALFVSWPRPLRERKKRMGVVYP